uniref:Uncharacterized protein n=1 Tax=Anopheles atroparvus TaxID=41427 RepID=A0A182JHJ1_ANOAO
MHPPTDAAARTIHSPTYATYRTVNPPTFCSPGPSTLTPLPAPPGQRGRGTKRRWDEANLRYNEKVLKVLERVSETSDRLMKERRVAKTDGEVFGQWVGEMIDEFSPERREAVKVAVRQIVIKADAARFRERTGRNPEEYFEEDEEDSL